MTTKTSNGGACEEKARWKLIAKWAGGKAGLLSEILRYVPNRFDSYHEPFFGGGAIFFGLREIKKDFPSFLSDSNAKLMAMYAAVRNDAQGVIDKLREHRNTEEHYYAVRSKNMELGSQAERAADLIFLNRAGYNGMFRENLAGKFNIPYGDNPKALLCDEVCLRESAHHLKDANITSGDFETLLRERMRKKTLGEGDLVYLDSPYLPLTKTADFTKYTRDGFTFKDHERLAGLVRDMIAVGIHVICSASSAEKTYELYAGLPIIEVHAKRSINSNGAKRGAVKEVLVVSPWLVEQAKEKGND